MHPELRGAPTRARAIGREKLDDVIKNTSYQGNLGCAFAYCSNIAEGKEVELSQYVSNMPKRLRPRRLVRKRLVRIIRIGSLSVRKGVWFERRLAKMKQCVRTVVSVNHASQRYTTQLKSERARIREKISMKSSDNYES